MVQFRRVAFGSVLVWSLALGTGWAQDRSEFRFSGVSLSGTYSTQQLPSGISGFEDVVLGTGRSASAATDIGWMKSSEDLFVSAAAGSVFGIHLHGEKPKSWNQTAAASIGTTFARRWNVSLGGSGAITTFDESLFVPSTLAKIASTEATLGDLATAVLHGEGTDPELANIGTLRPDLSQERFLFGRRTAALGMATSLSYAASRRLSVDVNAGVNNIRHLNDPSDLAGFVYPQAFSVGAGIGVQYSLSPRTQIGVGVTLARGGTSLHDLRNTGISARVSLSRTLRRYWFFEVSAGGGTDNAGSERNQSVSYSGGVGFRAASHTLLASYGHQIEDPYVVAIGSGSYVDAMSVAWTWNPVRSNWTVSGSFGDGRSHFVGLTTVVTTSGGVSASRSLGEHYGMSFSYGISNIGSKRYVQDGKRYQLQQAAYRVSFNWSPTPRVRR